MSWWEYLIILIGAIALGPLLLFAALWIVFWIGAVVITVFSLIATVILFPIGYVMDRKGKK